MSTTPEKLAERAARMAKRAGRAPAGSNGRGKALRAALSVRFASEDQLAKLAELPRAERRRLGL